jgi:uncharacterized membrane protein
MPARLQHWRNSARKYERPIVNGIALIIVALCMISLAEMLWTTTPIVFDTLAAWVIALPPVFETKETKP